MVNNLKLRYKDLKINQSAFIKTLLKKENMTNCNIISIIIKAKNFIKIFNYTNYKKVNF